MKEKRKTNERTSLDKRIEYWSQHGKKPEEITYSMLNEGFQSISGIPDDFYSAEDPADRVKLWGQHIQQTSRESEEHDYRGYPPWSD